MELCKDCVFGEFMKKSLIASIALAAALTICPAAFADTVFDVSFSGISLGNNMTFSGTFHTSPTSTAGIYDINSISNGTFTDYNGSLNISGTATLIPTSAGTLINQIPVNGALGASYLSPDGSEQYDNVLVYPENPDYLDGFGFLINVSGLYEVSIAQSLNPSDSTIYGAWVSNLGTKNSWVDTGPNFDYGEPIDFQAQSVQVTYQGGGLNTSEPSSLLLLATGLLGLAGVMRRKLRA